MDNQSDSLGVNKMGKNITKKSPLHQPNFSNIAKPQPHVYNINKNDFRNIVQQLTGSPSREPQPRPPQNNLKLPNNRLNRVRPPPLAPTGPQVPVHPHHRPIPHPPPPYPSPLLPLTPSDIWTNTNESPISGYMRYLQNSFIDPGPPPHLIRSPRLNGPGPYVPSPRMNGNFPVLPSPTSQFVLPSPNGFLNSFSPRSPYPWYTHPPPISPTFFGLSGSILGPGPTHPPLSPGYGYPFSPGFFPISSPRWS